MRIRSLGEATREEEGVDNKEEDEEEDGVLDALVARTGDTVLPGSLI